MSLQGKYSLGILLTFVLLAGVMLYVYPFLDLFMDTSGITATKFLYSRIILWIVLFLILLYCNVIEKHSILLWEERKYSILFYLGAVIALYFICALGGAFLNGIIYLFTHEKISSKLIQLKSIFQDNFVLIIITCLTAGVVEELLMRGYVQSRIEKIYNSPIAGVIISSILFGLLHSTYGTLGQIVGPFFIGVIFAMFYKLYSNIKILIICHFMFDFISIMIMNFVNIKHLSAF